MDQSILSVPPEHFNFAADVIDAWAADRHKLALWWVDAAGGQERRLTFAQVRDGSIAIAGAMREAGLERGDRVAVVLGRRPEWWLVMIGLVRAGLVVVPGTPLLTAKDLAYRIGAARIRGVVADPQIAAKVDEVRGGFPGLVARYVAGPREGWQALETVLGQSPAWTPVATRASDPCLVYFTSGTTGPPKMVLHTQVSYPLAHQTTGKVWLDLGPDDVHWNLSDTGWAKAAWSSLFGPWSQGATVFAQDSARFDPQAVLETLQRFPITSFCAPPTAFRQLIRLDLSGLRQRPLRHAVAAGEPLNPEVIAIWQQATGQTIRDGYGQTETTIVVGNFPGRAIKPGSMGLPAPGFEVEVVDAELRPLPAGQEGEIAIRVRPVRPLGLFAGYDDNPEENARRFQGDFYLTGDRAYRDQDGYFWFVGRADDVILSAGYRIGPFEVESALLEHPAVLEAAVVGAPDPVRYQIVMAFVVLRAGHSPSDELARQLQEHVKRVTAPFKYPRRMEFVESLPKTISGKIRRAELRGRTQTS